MTIPVGVYAATEDRSPKFRQLRKGDQFTKVSVHGGPPGVGKSYLTSTIAAAVSAGRRLPGDTRPPRPPGGVQDSDARRTARRTSPRLPTLPRAVLPVMHTRKSAADTALNRLAGSQAYGALVRSALMAGPVPDDEQGRYALAHVKHNLAPKQPTLAYTVGERGVSWHGEIDLDGEEVAGNSDGTDRFAGEEALAFLRDLLADDQVPASDVLAQAREAGIPKRTLERAKKALGIDSAHESDRWNWLPPREPTPTSRCLDCGLPLPDDPGLIFDGCHITCGKGRR